MSTCDLSPLSPATAAISNWRTTNTVEHHTATDKWSCYTLHSLTLVFSVDVFQTWWVLTGNVHNIIMLNYPATSETRQNRTTQENSSCYLTRTVDVQVLLCTPQHIVSNDNKPVWLSLLLDNMDESVPDASKKSINLSFHKCTHFNGRLSLRSGCLIHNGI